MCTLSIFQNRDTLKITMNRDERLDRAAELPPHIWDGGFIAPKDAQSGGTWIGAHFGTKKWACLLNGYAEGDASPTHTSKSRGTIIPSYLTQDRENFHRYIDLNKGHFASFRLVYGDEHGIYEMMWSGKRLSNSHIKTCDGWIFRSSSSWQQDRVVLHREEIFNAWQSDPQYQCKIGIPSFHASHERGNESSSILMRRSDPQRATTSLSMISIESIKGEMHYISSGSNLETLSALKYTDIKDINIKTIRNV